MQTILCVINNLVLKAGLEDWLAEHEVTFVTTAEEALDAIKQQNFQTVICHRDFAQLAEDISRTYPHTWVILFTEATNLIVVPMTISREGFKLLLERVH